MISLYRMRKGIDIFVDVLKKRGRPKSEDSKFVQLRVRLSRDESEMLDYVCAKRHQIRTEVVRQAIKAQYNLEKAKEY